MRVALLICLGMWVYVHLALTQGVIADGLYYRKSSRQFGCFLNSPAQPVMNKVTVLLVYDLPLVVMILALPVIQIARILGRRKATALKIGPNSLHDTYAVPVSEGTYSVLTLCWKAFPLFFVALQPEVPH